MQYELFKPMLDKIAGIDRDQEALGRGIVEGTRSAWSSFSSPEPSGFAMFRGS